MSPTFNGVIYSIYNTILHFFLYKTSFSYLFKLTYFSLFKLIKLYFFLPEFSYLISSNFSLLKLYYTLFTPFFLPYTFSSLTEEILLELSRALVYRDPDHFATPFALFCRAVALGLRPEGGGNSNTTSGESYEYYYSARIGKLSKLYVRVYGGLKEYML